MVKIPPLLALLFQNNGFLLRGQGTITTLITCRPWNMSRSNTLTQASLSHLNLCSGQLPASNPALSGRAEYRRGARRDGAPPSVFTRTGACGLALFLISTTLLLQRWHN